MDFYGFFFFFFFFFFSLRKLSKFVALIKAALVTWEGAYPLTSSHFDRVIRIVIPTKTCKSVCMISYNINISCVKFPINI
ncbi:hypothetical protein EUGRSUZ_G00439 [Eucalyptus grandis]|uniref:Uncharacterized protein n=2 Tax=Eucalyptus grandis TaxID=71139 RepID=A0ACC3K0I7_EUCGR|nr:hypothetical protein EUGRSUZ_G00439 [Eucalyptus grandis]